MFTSVTSVIDTLTSVTKAVTCFIDTVTSVTKAVTRVTDTVTSVTHAAIADCWHATLALFQPWILPPATPTPTPEP